MKDEMIFASQNGRKVPKEDKIFGISNRAKAAIAKLGKENVVNATIGALLDDEGRLIVLSSVDEVFRTLKPADFAEYAPIGGTAGFREAVKKDLLRGFKTERYVEAVATPGGTGAIRNTMSDYSSYGDRILTADWHWSPYGTIAQEMGRKIDTFAFFNEARVFDRSSFEEKVKELLKEQDRLVIILNTPSHNPTGYTLSEEDWQAVSKTLAEADKSKKIALLVDAAYVDFAGDEDEARAFLKYLEKMPESVLPIVACSLSKTYTLYGMRCGAMVCLAKTREAADEFRRFGEFSSRGSWSNCSRAPQVILERIYADEALLARVSEERKGYRDMLIRRGQAFVAAAEKVGLETVPFRGGFFVAMPCDEPDAVSARLEKENIFTVPLAKGVRVSLASVSEEQCRRIPAGIKKAMEG